MEEPSDVFWHFGSKAIIMNVAMRRPIFGNEYCRRASPDGFRRQRSTMQMVSLLRRFDSRDDRTSTPCGAPMSNDCKARGSGHVGARWSISLDGVHEGNGQRPHIGSRYCRFAGDPGD
jgi:hypothetical protein